MTAGVATFQRGLTAHRAGLATEAIAAYRAAVAADPTLAAAHFNLGQLLRDQLDFGGAAAAFERAATLKPSASDAWLNQGICREHLGELERALDCYREAARLEPDSAVAQFNSGNVMRTLGDLAGAAGLPRQMFVAHMGSCRSGALREQATGGTRAPEFGPVERERSQRI